ncbi:MAG: 16S rRNA processing protein RimM [Hyphomicrobiaceae bacterium]|jgi:16S rRNA processing protein RimM
MTDEPNLILLGHISSAQGIRGEVVIKSHTDDPAGIGSYGLLTDKTGKKAYDITVVRVAKKGVIARVKGVGDRTTAETLRGTELYIPRERLPEPEDDELYHADLIGLEAVSPEGDIIGEVVSIQNFGASDLLEVRLSGKARTEFIPMDDHFVPAIDLDAGRVTVVMP